MELRGRGLKWCHKLQATQLHHAMHSFFTVCETKCTRSESLKAYMETYDFVMFNNWLQFHLPATQQRLYSSDVPFVKRHVINVIGYRYRVKFGIFLRLCLRHIWCFTQPEETQVLQVVPRPPELKQFCYTWANALRAACVACHHFDIERRTVRQIGTNQLQVMPKMWDLRSHAQLGLIESRWH